MSKQHNQAKPRKMHASKQCLAQKANATSLFLGSGCVCQSVTLSQLPSSAQTKRFALWRSPHRYGGLYMMGSFDYNLLLVSAFHWDVIEVDLSIHHKQRIWLREHILVDTDTIKELLEN